MFITPFPNKIEDLCVRCENEGWHGSERIVREIWDWRRMLEKILVDLVPLARTQSFRLDILSD